MNSKAQIWVETVIYTLIALAIIGAVLAFVRPKIQEIQDDVVIEQSIEIMEYIDSKILEAVRGGSGNTRIVDMGIKKGSLSFDSAADTIVFSIDNTNYLYSEPGTPVNVGNVEILTEKTGGAYQVLMILNYSEKYDLQFDNTEEIKTLSKAPTPYKIMFENEGGGDSDLGTGDVVFTDDQVTIYVSDVVSSTGPILPGTYTSPYTYKITFTTGVHSGDSFDIVEATDNSPDILEITPDLGDPVDGDSFDIYEKKEQITINTKLVG